MPAPARLASLSRSFGSADPERIRPVPRRNRQKVSRVSISAGTSGSSAGPCDGQRTSMRCSTDPAGHSCASLTSWNDRRLIAVSRRSRSSGRFLSFAHASVCRSNSS